MSEISRATAYEMLGRAVKNAGGVRAFARCVGVSAAYVSDVMHFKRHMGKSIADPLGLKKTVVITRTEMFFTLPKKAR